MSKFGVSNSVGNSKSDNQEFGIGVVGMGGFAMFAVQHFVQLDGVSLVAIAETHNEPALAAAKRFGVDNSVDLDVMLAHPGVDLVYIGTPPFLHYQQAKAALEAGKHVICEKPLALRSEQAFELSELAKSRGLCLVANLMQRYNPIYAQVHAVLDRKLLGEPLYARFENFACDEGLKPDHWFWDREKSGGIFLEHAVHFFDMFEGWFGEGKLHAASRMLRKDSGVEEQVTCSGRFGEVDAYFIHSFTQANRMDRQEFRIGCERGDIVLNEWVPTRLRIEGLVDETTCRQLVEIFPHAHLRIPQSFGGDDRKVTARFKRFEATQRIKLTLGEGDEKYDLYGDMVRHLLADQLAWIRQKDHKRATTEENAVRSVVLAEEATKLAELSSQ